LVLGAACSDGGEQRTTSTGAEATNATPSTEETAMPPTSDEPSSTATPMPTTTLVSRPEGPAATVSGPVSGGNGVYLAEPLTSDIAAAGFVEHEYFAEGTATSYAANEVAGDGRWSFTPVGTAPYRTRVLVRTPGDPAKFSGTVVLEWLNVSGGVDADPEWAAVHEEILRQGHAWVGVSAQRIGVMGGPVLVRTNAPGSELAGLGLRAIDPARYGTLDHPGDGFAFDIYTQVARAIRAGAGLSGLVPERLVAAGESQSAFALVTYYNGVQPLTSAFDGFFVHSRGATAMALVGPGESSDLAGSVAGTATTFRDDLAAPVMNLQTETDVVGILSSYAARQPDSDTFRLWEVAGTAHFDLHLLGASAAYLDCGYPINNGPLDVVAKAALRGLTSWIETGVAPPAAPRLETTDGEPPQLRLDGDGIALGGIRTPPVDVPVATLSGAAGPGASLACLLFGSTTPFTAERLAELYPSSTDYEQRYEQAADAVIEAGFVLDDDRAGLLAYADASSIP
jgi:hypothetical protein